MITIHRDKDHNGLIAMVSTCKNVAKIDMTAATNEKHLELSESGPKLYVSKQSVTRWV